MFLLIVLPFNYLFNYSLLMHHRRYFSSILIIYHFSFLLVYHFHYFRFYTSYLLSLLFHHSFSLWFRDRQNFFALYIVYLYIRCLTAVCSVFHHSFVFSIISLISGVVIVRNSLYCVRLFSFLSSHFFLSLLCSAGQRSPQLLSITLEFDFLFKLSE